MRLKVTLVGLRAWRVVSLQHDGGYVVTIAQSVHSRAEPLDQSLGVTAAVPRALVDGIPELLEGASP